MVFNLIILFALALLISLVPLVLRYLFLSQGYNTSEYQKQTNLSFFKVYCDKGKLGEYLISKELKNIPGCKRFLFNCYIPKKDGTTSEIDVIMLHETGIYVFESKNYSGWIFGSEAQPYWTQTLPKGKNSEKNKFYNPIIQNKGHIAALSMYLEITPDSMISYIVFSERCTLKSINLASATHTVTKRENISSLVRDKIESSACIFTSEQIDSLYSKLFTLTQVSNEQKEKHIIDIKETLTDAFAESHIVTSPVINDPIKHICPKCGGNLVLKRATRGERAGKQFYGCSNYPNCKYIENID